MKTETRGTLLEYAGFDEAVHDLAHYHSDEGVLTVYLDLDPGIAVRRGFEAELSDLWKPLQARVADPWTRGRLEYEIAAVEEEAHGWPEAPGRAVAMFFSGPGGLRSVMPLRFPMRSVARFEARPMLSPLIAALEEHERYCVVMFDKNHARILTIFLGEVEDEEMLQSDVLGRSAVGGFAQAGYARHREHQLHEHARRTIEHLWAIDRSRPIHSLVLAGPDEALAELRLLLPKALSRIVVGTMPQEMFAVSADVVKHVERLEAAARAKHDDEIAGQVVEAHGTGGAALGWEETLAALSDGRVHLLVVMPGVTRSGVQCPEGHFAGVRPLTNCPACDEPLWKTEDAAEAAVRMAMLTDADVRFVCEGAAERLGSERIGALLRY